MGRNENGRAQSKKKMTTIILVVIGILLAVLAVLYLVKAFYYKEHFYPGTIVNGHDCSNLTIEETENLLQETVDSYIFEVLDKDSNSYTIAASELEIKYESNGEIVRLMESQNPMEWIFRIGNPIQGSVSEEFTYNTEILKNWFGALQCVTAGTDPVDAYKEIQEDGYWHIVPENPGSKIDIEKALDIIDNAIRSGEQSIILTYDEAYVKPQITSDDTALNQEVETLNAEIAYQKEVERVTNVTVSFSLVVDDVEKKATLTPSDLKNMIVKNDEGNPIVSGDKVIEWLTKWAEDNGLLDDQYLFVNCYGKIMSLPNGTDTGWKFDVTKTAVAMYDAIDKLESKSITPVLLDQNGEEQKNQTYVEIIIPEQRMLLHQNGQIIVDTPVVTGSLYTELDYYTYTPSNGIWHIFWKTTDYHMKGPIQDDGTFEYESYVSYWMPFNNDIGIHDMNRTEFGGDIYLYNGSHGCINTPIDAAKKIYETVKVGTPVIVWGDSEPIEEKEEN